MLAFLKTLHTFVWLKQYIWKYSGFFFFRLMFGSSAKDDLSGVHEHLHEM